MTAPVQRAEHRARHKCGFDATYDTAGKAAYALRRHSCAKHLAVAARRKRGAELRASVDRTPKPCLHPRADHQHGTYACYTLDRCRCQPCAEAVTVYERNRVRQQAYGRWDNLVDAGSVRLHVRSLMAAGMGYKRVAEAAGVSVSSVGALLYGHPREDGSSGEPSARIAKGSASRLLAVGLEVAGGARVDGTGTVRRLQALVALGYSQSRLGRETGLDVQQILVSGRDVVLRTSADSVRTTYDRLSMTPNRPTVWHEAAAASRARNAAKSRGWAPPLAWDDDTIDDPQAQPHTSGRALDDVDLTDQHDEAAVTRRLDGDRAVAVTAADRVEIVRRARESGWSLLDIERRAGIAKPERYLTTTNQITQEAS